MPLFAAFSSAVDLSIVILYIVSFAGGIYWATRSSPAETSDKHFVAGTSLFLMFLITIWSIAISGSSGVSLHLPLFLFLFLLGSLMGTSFEEDHDSTEESTDEGAET